MEVELGSVTGRRTLSFDVSQFIDPSDTTAAIEDTLHVYLVAPTSPGQTLLDRGVNGTSLFTISSDSVEFAPGLVQFDGTIVEIDVTSVEGFDTGLLMFQLLNSDSDTGSRFEIGPVTNTVDELGEGSTLVSSIVTSATAESGEPLNLPSLQSTSDINPQFSNAHFNSTTGKYIVNVRLQNIGAPTGRDVAVLFEDLPDGVSLINASGSDANGNPYVNMRNAIANGGLGSNEYSQFVQLEFDDPSLVQFPIRTSVLVGAPNQGPVFNAITPQTLMPGEVLTIELDATDPDGEPVTFTMTPGEQMPTTLLSGNTLTFRPTPDQIGEYSFVLHSSDGSVKVSQTVFCLRCRRPYRNDSYQWSSSKHELRSTCWCSNRTGNRKYRN